MSTPNWARLVTQGRAKAFGISWNDKELKALEEIAVNGVTREMAAEFVRRGALTRDAYEEMKVSDEKAANKGEKPVDAMSRAELIAEAKAEGNEVTPDATAPSLRDVVKRKPGKK